MPSYGAFYNGNAGGNWSRSNGIDSTWIQLDASRSSAIFSDVKTVQPKAAYIFMIIKA